MEQCKVEVFKTNIILADDASLILQLLNSQYPNHKVNFDLEDCDKILRVEGFEINKEQIINLFITRGIQCEILI